jgi:hypothetical protein
VPDTGSEGRSLVLWRSDAAAARLRLSHPPHEDDWLCIHSHEAGWDDHDTGRNGQQPRMKPKLTCKPARDGADVRAAALTALSLVTPFVPASAANYSHHHRPASTVRLIVVHETEGSFAATVKWFRNPKARAAANYVVGRDGKVVHMVADSYVPWHAGNSYVNAHSIGVEHEGYTGVQGTLTDAEYRASARLVAGLLRRYRLPADRGHVIGHDEVPDPYHRGAYGGYSHHTDPGRYFDWPRYMAYVRDYAAGRTPPPRAVDVTLDGLSLDAAVTGVVPLAATPTGDVEHVDFLVDGVVRATVGAPFTWDWDTSLETNGRHVLAVRAGSAVAAVTVTSSTPPAPPPTVELPELAEPLSGVVQLTPTLGGGPVAKVELWIDGVVVQTVDAEPWTLTWDTSTVGPGQHTLAIRAVGPRGRPAAAVAVVTVG